MPHQPDMHIFGEVLFDHFPDGSRVLGGAPFNVAWHLQAFGQQPRFISRVGSDPEGQEIAARMAAWGMSRDAMQIDPEHPTGRVRVMIEHGEPQYEITADCAYDFIAAEAPAAPTTAGILYHGSLATRTSTAYETLQALKTRHRGKIFIDVNLRQPWWQREQILHLLGDADWVKLNEVEFAMLYPAHGDLHTAMPAFCAQFSLKGLIVTRGANGAIACTGQERLMTVNPPATAVPVVDTVGAGDAFAAVLLLGLSRYWPVTVTMERAQAFASAVAGQRGATIADEAFYRPFSAAWQLAPPVA